MPDQQKEIDFSTRGGRLRLLDRVELPALAKSRTSPAAMIAVLRCLESHARDKATCYPAIPTIAAETKLSVSAVGSALRRLKALCLIDNVRTGGPSVYRIIWSNLADYDPAQKADDDTSDRASCEIGSRTMRDPISHDAASDSAPCANGSRTMRDPISHDARSYREAPSETQNEPPPPPPSEAPDAWAEVEEVLRNELRIFTATKCVAEMRRRGESVDDALKAIEEFREGMRSERFQNEGALQGRLVNGLWPDDRQRREAEEKRRRARRKQEHLQASLAAYAAGEDRRPNEKPVAAAMEKFIPTESWIPPDKRRSPG